MGWKLDQVNTFSGFTVYPSREPSGEAVTEGRRERGGGRKGRWI